LLGYCPHGCGEKLSESNYISWGILSCPHCKKRTVSRGEGNQFRLLQYFSNCPTCDTPMAEDDRFAILQIIVFDILTVTGSACRKKL
jgi:hypothetical protein